MDCGRCGLELESPREDGLFCDGDTLTCECGAGNQISVDEAGDPGCEVYVQGWTRKHGADDETPCPTCDAEDESARAPGSDEGAKT
jgi:hypothetical protein